MVDVREESAIKIMPSHTLAVTGPQGGLYSLLPSNSLSPPRVDPGPSPGQVLHGSREGLLPADLGFLHGAQVGVINDILLPIPDPCQGGVLLQN